MPEGAKSTSVLEINQLLFLWESKPGLLQTQIPKAWLWSVVLLRRGLGRAQGPEPSYLPLHSPPFAAPRDIPGTCNERNDLDSSTSFVWGLDIFFGNSKSRMWLLLLCSEVPAFYVDINVECSCSCKGKGMEHKKWKGGSSIMTYYLATFFLHNWICGLKVVPVHIS